MEKALHAFSIKDGTQLWTGDAKMNHHKAPDLFLTGGVVWTGYGGKYTAYDRATGEVVKTIEQAMTGPMGHDRCYRNRITDRFYPRIKGDTLYAGQLSGTTAVPTAAEATAPSDATPPTGRKVRRAAGATRAQTKTTRKKKTAGSPRASERWSSNIPLTGKAMALAGNQLFVAGTPVVFPKDDLAAAYEGRMGGVLWVASADSGTKLAESKLDAPPSWDGMAVAQGRLFVVLQDGSLQCFAAK